ncbi:Hsp33 family molecular chaperone HslO [Rhodoferax saidenbachensis]|uniref:Molecular chaperone Hsp33 n=1 Tax=Rhodoferax saidenbachensis TaxID=1484693 RepID=A0ABU1ZTG1_9BURK|nr:Hsp33 family molecular chaperone HslO [Rhodoferax saidenbachensis]MDR7307816.1 molecular chaperone Hsp33 [Rhodoferax saidenbachensis]
MSELHKFLFDGLPVRGAIVRLTDAWVEILRRRASNSVTGAYPVPVQDMLGEMTAAATLMQSNIKFDGALVLQIFGDGPVKVAVVEVQSDLTLRATATVAGDMASDATLSQMVNASNQGRCAITLDPKTKFPGQQPYQGVVPLFDDHGRPIEKLSEVLEHYMLQSEQLDTTLVLAANDKVAAGLLIQRLPMAGQGNLSGSMVSKENEDAIGVNEHYNRIATLASSLKREELLNLDVDTILRRLFWEEQLVRFEPLEGETAPRFVCSCSRERVARMIVGLGRDEVETILTEREDIEVACEFCGVQYRFDPVDAAELFAEPVQRVAGGSTPH